jgi:cysteine synthase A
MSKKVYENNSETIGHSPLVHLNKLFPDKKVYGKVEFRNPANSVKCRIGYNMILDAEKKGILTKDKILIEPTSGNTGIALAMGAASKGYKLVLVMPETMSIERRQLMAALGAQLVLTPGGEGMKGAINRATEMATENPETYYMLQQFNNPSNPEIHEKTTGPEIWEDTNGEIDVLISGVGTGGTLSGISRYIKNNKGKNITSVAIEPFESQVIKQTLNKEPLKPSPHKIQGIGLGFVPNNLDLTMVDETQGVTNEDAFKYAAALMAKEGILAGISSGAAVAAVQQLFDQSSDYNDKTIVVILPDSGERYLSTPLFTSEEYIQKQNHIDVLENSLLA